MSQLAIISNRTPDGPPSGGAMVVINEGDPAIWVGPQDVPDKPGDETADDLRKGIKPYSSRSEAERYPLTPSLTVDRSEWGQPPLAVYRSPQKRSEQKLHYAGWSNGIAWPVLHGMNPKDFAGQDDSVSQESKRKNLRRGAFHLGITEAQLENNYAAFCSLNDNLNNHLARLRKEGVFTKDTICETHDYQMPGVYVPDVKGNLFFSHIPFPPLDVLKKYVVDQGDRFHARKTVPLVKTEAWRKYTESMILPYDMLAFQRPQDMHNFLESLEYYQGKETFRKNNPALYDQDGILATTPMGRTGARQITYVSEDGKGHRVEHRAVVMSQVVGTSVEKNLKEAQDNENRLDQTKFRVVRDGKFNPVVKAEYAAGEMDAAQAKACGVPELANLTLKSLLSKRRGVDGKPLNLLEADGHNLFVSFHRNDYTKSTIEKLDAIETYLDRQFANAAEEPERVGKDHFVIFAQPTRLMVGGYRQYGDRVVKKTEELRKKFGDCVIVVPAGVKHEDLMGLMRNKNVAAVVSTGKKDGCDLTQDEAMHANIDRLNLSNGLGIPLANVTTDGTGAAEKYSSREDRSGSTDTELNGYIVRSSEGSKEMEKDLIDAFEEISRSRQSPAGRQALAARNGHAMAAAKKFDARYFHREMLDTLCEKALPPSQYSHAGYDRVDTELSSEKEHDPFSKVYIPYMGEGRVRIDQIVHGPNR